MPSVLITGGTGLIGKSLTRMLLGKRYEVILLSRHPSAGNPAWPDKVQIAAWDPEKQTMDPAALRSADYIIHLAGANIAQKRWTGKRKKEIERSRTAGGELLIKALKEIPNRVKAVISASAIGWYGPDATIPPEKYFVETDPAHRDFLGETCRRWEASIDPVKDLGKRLVKLRTGIVLAREGGALPEFMRPLRFNTAAILGNGTQMVSWIHIEDLCRIFLEAIESEKINGVYNAVAPNPVSNKTLTLTLARQLKGKKIIPVHLPAILLKIILGEMSIEVLKSCSVSADKIKNTGFQFLYPDIETAFKALCAPRGTVRF